MKAYTYNDRLVGVGNDQILGTDQGSGPTYTAGDYISIENDVISVTGLAPVSAIPDVSDMATKTWVGNQGYLTEVPSTYATDTEVYNATVTAIEAVTGSIGGDNVFIAQYGTTTYNAIKSAYNDGKAVFVNYVDGMGEIYLIPMLHIDENEVAYFTAQVTNSSYVDIICQRYSPDPWNISIRNYNPLQVQANWNESNSSSKAYIQNKPSIPTVQLNNNDQVTAINNYPIAGGGGGGSTYTAGEYISIDSNDIISVTGLAPVSGSDGITVEDNVVALDTPVEIVPGDNIAISVNSSSAIISVTGIVIPDTSDMATKTWVGNQGYLTSVPSTYATDIEVSQAIASSIPTFTEGNCIDITSNAISWETTAGITDIVSVTALPANPVATVIYLIKET